METICKNCLRNMEVIDDSHFVTFSREIHWCKSCGSVLKLYITTPTKYVNMDISRKSVDVKEEWRIPESDPYEHE